MRRRAISVSQAEDYAECKWKYRAKSIEKQPLPVSDPMEFGRVEHEAAQVYIQRLIAENKTRDLSLVPDVWNQFVRTRQDGGIRDRQFGAALTMLEKFARNFELDLERVWKPEAEIALTWEGRSTGWWSDDVFLRMKLDLPYVDGPSATIIDLKTGYSPISKSEMKDNKQARTYPMGLWKKNPAIEYGRTIFYYMRWDIERESPVFTTADFAECWEWWHATSDRIEGDIARLRSDSVWKPTPGPWCNTCEVADRCPLVVNGDRNRLAELMLVDDASEKQAAELAFAYEGAATLLKKKLRNRVEATGAPVPYGDGVIGFHHKHYIEYDNAKAAELAQSYGAPVSDFMKVDRRAAESARFRKMYPLLSQELANHRYEDGGVEFKYKKTGGDE